VRQLHDEVVLLRAETARLRTERNRATDMCARLVRRVESLEYAVDSLSRLVVKYRLEAGVGLVGDDEARP
jgi:hypothetical protein